MKRNFRMINDTKAKIDDRTYPILRVKIFTISIFLYQIINRKQNCYQVYMGYKNELKQGFVQI